MNYERNEPYGVHSRSSQGQKGNGLVKSIPARILQLPPLNYCKRLNFHRQHLCCSFCNNTASSLETDMYHKTELHLTLRSVDLVSAKAFFQNSHSSNLPAFEAVTLQRCFGGWVGLAFGGLGRIHSHYRQVNLTENSKLRSADTSPYVLPQSGFA